MRLQDYGVGIFKTAFTKSALKKVIKKNYVKVNDCLATTATFINGGERITLEIPEDKPQKIQFILSLNVLFEDDYLAIIHKPAGILVSGNRFKTIANALHQNLKESNLPDAIKPQPVHRLDYATTGLLLVGKTSSSIRALNLLFETKNVLKTYLAVAIGNMKLEGNITTPVDGKPSESNYQVLDTVISKRFGKLNLVQLKPKTGRRHQLRKHLSSIGNPILGDKTYGIEGLILNGKGMYLHACALNFMHPFTKKPIYATDEFPERFKKLFPNQRVY